MSTSKKEKRTSAKIVAEAKSQAKKTLRSTKPQASQKGKKSLGAGKKK